MAEQSPTMTLPTMLWRQFGAAIDMLENVLLACPPSLWREQIWGDPQSADGATFWSLTYHTLFWLDLYLIGDLESFAPPAPFVNVIEPDSALPEQPYTRDELHGYLVQLRKKCEITITELTDEKAHQLYSFPWLGGTSLSFFELQLYSMRHVQEHTAQLSLVLGRHGISDEVLDWVPWAKTE